MARRALVPTAFAIAALGVPMPALASFHLWEIGEVYSDADGAVQYIELFSADAGQTQVGSQEIIATWSGGSNTFTFPGDISGSTTNKRLLIATPGFASLAGAVSADFILPAAPFFDPNGVTISINFVAADAVTFSATSLPVDGFQSLYFTAGGTTSTASNSPTNFAGETGSLIPGTVFRNGFE